MVGNIRCDETGRIVEFRAINAVHGYMRTMQPPHIRMGGKNHAVRDPAANHP
jgi:hypothetical protein